MQKMIIKYTIPNWEKYNTLLDGKEKQWMKLSTSSWEDAKLQSLTHTQHRIWFVMLNYFGCRPSAERMLSWCILKASANLKYNGCIADAERLHSLGLLKIINIEELREFSHNTILKKRREEKRREENTIAEKKISANEKPIRTPIRTPRKKKQPTHSDADLGARWFKFALEEMPWTEPRKGWSEESFGEAVLEIREKTGLNDKGTEALFDFIANDDFWRVNALSPKSLLKKKTGDPLRKIDKILARMKTKADREKSVIKNWVESDKETENPFARL